MRGYFVAGFLLPVALFFEMAVHIRELNDLVRVGVAKQGTTRSLTVNATEKPLFVLHVGPSKTATTTIQCAAAKGIDLLGKDNFYFLGHDWRRPEWDLHEFVRMCYSMDASRECAEKWSELEHLVRHHYSLNHNLFLSEEMITMFSNNQVEQENLWRHLERLLTGWRVRIVFSYRRYHEWIPSKYHQAFNPKGPKATQLKRENWPDNGGRPIPAFPKHIRHMIYKDEFRMPPAIVKRWSIHFPNVQIFNMHQEGDLLENFFCKMLPEAPRMCQYLGKKKKEMGTDVKNPSSAKILHFDMIAVRAYQKGWVSKNMTRIDVTRAVTVHAEKLGLSKVTDFPLECFPANQTKELLRQAIEYEAEMVPQFFSSPRGKKELVSQFADAVEKGKFCSIDVRRILKQKGAGWKEFFRKLSPSDIPKLGTDGKRRKRRKKKD